MPRTKQTQFIAAMTGPRKALGASAQDAMHFGNLSVAFTVFLLVVASVFLRPAEMVPALANVPVYELLLLTSLCFAAERIQDRFRFRTLRQQPVNMCVVGMMLAVVLSHATHLYLFGTWYSSEMFLKVLVVYALMITVVDSNGRFRKLAFTLAVFGTITVGMCVVDYIGWHDFASVTHVKQSDDVDLTNTMTRVIRMRGTGIFQDPNDLSQLIVLTGVICTFFLTRKSQGPIRYAWLLPLVILAVGLLFTRSRGGLLATGFAGLTLLGVRFGRKGAIAAVICGTCLLPLIGGRQTEMDLSGDTGGERIQLWRDGIHAIKNGNIFFGVGQGMYADYAGLVAHNSFIHAYVELGFFGGTMFFGMFFFVGLQLWRMRTLTEAEIGSLLKQFHPYMMAILAGWCGGMLSLSRCYVVPTYLVVGMSAAYLTLVSNKLTHKRFLAYWSCNDVRRLVVASALCLAGFVIFVRVIG